MCSFQKLGLASSRKLSWSLFLLLGSSETVSEQFLLLIYTWEGRVLVDLVNFSGTVEAILVVCFMSQLACLEDGVFHLSVNILS